MLHCKTEFSGNLNRSVSLNDAEHMESTSLDCLFYRTQLNGNAFNPSH